MPIFDFQCQHCNFSRERIISFNESEKNELKTCPECLEKKFKKVNKIYRTSWKPGTSFHNGGYVSN